MEFSETLTFVDDLTGDEGVVIVRASNGILSLCLSLKLDGDVEINIDAHKSEAIIEMMRRALSSKREQD